MSEEIIGRTEPENKIATVFIEADEFFVLLKKTFGEQYLSFRPNDLALAICKEQGWELGGLFVYVSYQNRQTNPLWNNIWSRTVRNWRAEGIQVFQHEWGLSPVNALNSREGLENFNSVFTIQAFNNNLVKNQMICDVINEANKGDSDVFVLITKDKALAPVANAIRDISFANSQWMKVINAFPYVEPPEGVKNSYHCGIDGTDWYHISREMYYACSTRREVPLADDKIED